MAQYVSIGAKSAIHQLFSKIEATVLNERKSAKS